eukprot:365015-Chlamydomonas_euryale.AAC.1
MEWNGFGSGGSKRACSLVRCPATRRLSAGGHRAADARSKAGMPCTCTRARPVVVMSIVRRLAQHLRPPSQLLVCAPRAYVLG